MTYESIDIDISDTYGFDFEPRKNKRLRTIIYYSIVCLICGIFATGGVCFLVLLISKIK